MSHADEISSHGNACRILFAALSLTWVAAARAQPGIAFASVSSVEWMAADSPLIVRAVIDDVSDHDPADGSLPYQTVSVRVLETLKGKPCDRLQFIDAEYPNVRLSKLKQDQPELLLFMKPLMQSWESSHIRDGGAGYAYTRFPYAVEHKIILTPHDVHFADQTLLPPLSCNLKKLSTPTELIDTIKAYLKNRRDQGPARSVTTELPLGLGGYYESGTFTFPADAGDHPQPPAEIPLLDFATFKERFGKKPPDEKKPPYLRTRNCYIGVYALELMAADCDAIVRGVVEDSCFVAATNDAAGPACGVKFRVLETLKGKAAGQVNFFVSDARDLEALRRDRQELVVFLRDKQRSGPPPAFSYPIFVGNQKPGPVPADFLGYETRASLWDDSVIVLDPRAAEALFADLTWHRQPDEILKRLRAVAESERSQKPTSGTEPPQFVAGRTGPAVFDFHPAASIAAGSSIAGNEWSIVYLPVGQELEANAQKWAVAKDKDLRWVAARAMIYFKSDTNAALLRTLLDDKATWSRDAMSQLLRPYRPNEDPQYLVRWEAWQVLEGWGYAPPILSFRAGR